MDRGDGSRSCRALVGRRLYEGHRGGRRDAQKRAARHEQLGTFIELEAVAPADSDLDHEHRLIAELRDALGITDERLVALGYAAQLLQASSDPDAR